MKSNWTKLIGFIAVAALTLSACAGGGDSLEGKWELTSDASFLGDDEALYPEDGEEFYEIEVFFIFGGSDELLLEIPITIDYEGIFSSSGFDATVDIVAEPLNMLVSFGGTYEQLSGGILEMELDPTSVAYSPTNYCFSVGGEEICQDLGEMPEEFEATDFELGAGSYEIDGSTLTIWDDDCDYPTDQTCAMIFTKVE